MRIKAVPEFLERNMLVSRMLFLILIISLWEWAGLTRAFYFSRPSAIVLRITDWIYTGFIIEHFWVTFQEMALGFSLGFILGISTGLLLGSVKFLAQSLDPFLYFLYTLPRIALVPLFIVWFGFGLNFKVATVFFIVYFMIHYFIYYGMKDVDLELVNVLKVMRASKWEIYRKVILPYLTLWIFSSLKVALPRALMGAIVAEYIAATKGLGFIIFKAGDAFDTTGVFAGVVLLGLFSVFLFLFFDQVEKRALRWHVGAKAFSS